MHDYYMTIASMLLNEGITPDNQPVIDDYCSYLNEDVNKVVVTMNVILDRCED